MNRHRLISLVGCFDKIRKKSGQQIHKKATSTGGGFFMDLLMPMADDLIYWPIIILMIS